VEEGFSQAQVTFVIPSIGRPSIDAALQTLLAQTNPNWRALVIYDGADDKNPTIKDPRIEIIHKPKMGSAGATRNAAVPYIQTKWVAFLDDDDGVSPDYVDKLLKTANEMPSMDILAFHVKGVSSDIINPSGHNGTVLKIGDMGISFATQKTVFDKVLFKPILGEDITFLYDAKKAGKTIVLSEYLTYAIRPGNITPDWKPYMEFRATRETVTDVVV
jgi:glycosyltransferase involved in cell wall biosynthesis